MNPTNKEEDVLNIEPDNLLDALNKEWSDIVIAVLKLQKKHVIVGYDIWGIEHHCLLDEKTNQLLENRTIALKAITEQSMSEFYQPQKIS